MENLKKSFLVRGNNIVGFSDKKNFSTAPLGTVLSFAGQARPNGYLLCDGASYKVTDYPDLYAVIGNTYGGDSTNFNVPNLVDASQSPAPTMIYIIKAFHTNEGVDSDAGSGEKNKIDSISVNGSPVSIDENKNVDITVPDAYDDTALVKRVSDIESDYATKDEIPTVPSKVSELTNDSNYQTAEQVNNIVTIEIAKVVSDAPENLNTLKEMSDWIAGHENDASAMNSVISNNKTSIETLQTNVSNINTSLGGKLNKTFIGDDVGNKVLSTDENGNVVLKDNDSNEGTAETTSYTNANYPDYTNVDLALNALFNKVYYVKPTCSLSVDKQGGTFEMGTVISAPITFNWTTNKDIKSQTLTDCTLADASVRSATYNTDVSSDKIFTLTVSDDESSASSSVSYKFMNNVFWGSASIADTYDSAFINALPNKKLTASVNGTYSFNVAEGEFGFWAVPSNMTISTIWVNGFSADLDYLGTVSYTNVKGYTTEYKLYKTSRPSLGAFSAEIK